MAKIPLKEIKFPDLADTYTIPQVDNTLTTSGDAADAKKTGDEIDALKEDLTNLAPKEDMLKAFPTDTASGAVASFNDGANVPVKSLIVNIDPVQSGSGDPSPTNIRPITGWTWCNVQRTGKNLFDSNFSDYTKPYNYYICPIKLENGKRYKLKSELVGTTITGASLGLVKSGNRYEEFVGPYYTVETNGDVRDFNITVDDTFTAPKLVAYVSGENQFNELLSNYNIMLMPYEQAEYEPYSGQSITIDLGQTVYGGTIDVPNGVLTIVDAKDVYDGSSDEQWYRFNTGSAQAFAMQVTLNHAYKVSCDNLRTNYLKPIPTTVVWGNEDNWISAQNDGAVITGVKAFTTLEDWKVYLAQNPLEVVYELITPLTVQLTPHEVTALLGSNNVWADSGDSEVTYRADPKLYIQRLTEPDADMVADANIVSGQYFMVGNTLYKATANIASGATISPNVNCTRKSLSEALNELNA